MKPVRHNLSVAACAVPGIAHVLAAAFLYTAAVYAMPSAVSADDLLMSVGKTIMPRGDVTVRLAAEEVKIVIDEETARLSCAYYLMNEGDADSVTAGFPRGWEGDIEDFRAYADGYELATSTPTEQPVYISQTGRPSESRWWKLFTVPLNRDSHIVEVFTDYSTRLLSAGNLSIEDLSFTYVMTTGASWKGPIENSRVAVYLDDIDFDRITHISPEGYTRINNRITWIFSDFEPKENIEITFMRSEQFYTLRTVLGLLESNPDNAHALFLAGAVHFIRSFFESSSLRETAETELKKAVTLDPGHLDARFFLAALYHYAGDTVGLRRELSAIAERDPSYVCTHELFPRAFYTDIPDSSAAAWLEAIGSE